MVSYNECKHLIKPFDVIVIKGGEHISNAIRFIQQVTLGVKERKDVWSHMGLVVTRELYDDPRLKPGKLYLIESTLSGKFNDGVKNIDGKSFFGVQIRDLDKLAKKYTKNKKGGIGWARLRNNPFALPFDEDKEEGEEKEEIERLREIKRREYQLIFTKIYPMRWEKIRYNFNLIYLAAAVWPIFSPLKWGLEKIDFFNSDEWLFCSELVFDILQVFNFYDGHFDSSVVLPQDFFGYDTSTPPIPQLFDDPVEFSSYS